MKAKAKAKVKAEVTLPEVVESTRTLTSLVHNTTFAIQRLTDMHQTLWERIQELESLLGKSYLDPITGKWTMPKGGWTPELIEEIIKTMTPRQIQMLAERLVPDEAEREKELRRQEQKRK